MIKYYQILEIISNCCNLNSILFIWALLPFFFTLLNYQILSDTWTNIELFQPKIHPFHLTTFTTFLNIIELSNTVRYLYLDTLNNIKLSPPETHSFHLIVVSNTIRCLKQYQTFSTWNPSSSESLVSTVREAGALMLMLQQSSVERIFGLKRITCDYFPSLFDLSWYSHFFSMAVNLIRRFV